MRKLSGLIVVLAACAAAPKPFDGSAMYRSGNMHELRDRLRSERAASADAAARNAILLARVYIDLRVVWDDATLDDASAALASAHPADPRLVAELEQARGEVLFWRKLADDKGAWEDIRDRFERARELRVAAHDARGVAESTFYRGLVAQFLETTADARVWFERALELGRNIDDPLLRSYPVRHLADLAEQAGDLDKAAALHREALELRERAGDVVRLFNARVTLATFLCERMCDCESARPQIAEARRIADALRMPHGKTEVAALEARLAQPATACERPR